MTCTLMYRLQSFYICIVVSQTLGESTPVQMSLLVCEGKVGELVQPGGMQGLP